MSTLNLATNPRLVKEIELADNNHFRITVISFEFDNWSKNSNDNIKNRFKNINFLTIPTSRRYFALWFWNAFKTKLYRFVCDFHNLTIQQKSQLISNRSDKILKYLNYVSKVDLVIGHNPGAIYPTLFAADKFNCNSAFDVEDYHPGEGSDRKVSKITMDVMNYCFPNFSYVSFASDLFQNRIESEISIKIKNRFTILNYFKSEEFIFNSKYNSDKIKFVWFSQNISKGRGLEQIIYLFQQPNSNLELHLYGELDQKFYKDFIYGNSNIFIHSGFSQVDLHRELSLYDIGFAIDIPVDENRKLAITNKILAYLQAGLFIFASDIPSHRFIFEKHRINGMVTSMTKSEISLSLSKIQSTINHIRIKRKDRFERSRQFCWELESHQLINSWQSLLN